MRYRLIPSCVAVILSMLLPAAAVPSSREDGFQPVRLERAEIRLDGRLEDEAWSAAPPLCGWYQLCPDEGCPPSERTEMRLLYDRDFLYLGARCFVNDPSTLVSRSLERDSFTPDQDAVAMILDTLDDNRTAYGFIVNPEGVRTDIAISNDGEGHRDPWNKDWNAFWDAVTVREPWGWSVEIRIPFTSLRFEAHGGRVRMGLILWRYMARNVEFDVFPEIPNRWRFSAYKPSRARKVMFTGIRSRHPLYLKPYVLGGLGRTVELNPDETAYRNRDLWKREAGLDLKYNLTSNLILDVTLNTDFAQVEADDQKVNLTRFSLFFPEKRSFFQERSDLFQFRLPGGQQLLFHSRSIGLVEGEAVPLLGGVRLTGRAGRWEIGFMEMQTGKAEIEEGPVPAENFGVLRIKHRLMADGSYVGGIVTSRSDLRGAFNVLAAVDADVKLKFPHYFNFTLARSFEPGGESGKSWMGTLIFRNRIERGFSYGVSATHLGGAFNPGMGFLIRNGINRFGSRIRYSWFPEPSSPFQNHGLTSRLEYVAGADSGRLETFIATFGWSGLSRSGAEGELNIKFTREDLIEGFEIGDVEVPPGSFRFWNAELRGKTPSGRPLRLDLEARGGGYFGGRSWSGTLTPSWTISPHLGFKLDFNTNRASLPAGDYISHVIRLRVLSALDRRLSASAYLQYNSETRRLTSNLRIRYNPSEGIDLYLVYNEGVNTDLNLESPRLPRIDSRTLLVKFNYTFVL